MRRWRILSLLTVLLLPLFRLQHVRGQVVEGGAFLLSPVVYVDFEYVGDESGTEEEPFNSIDEALATVEEGGTIFVAPGVTHETLPSVAMPVTLTYWNVASPITTVTIGDITSCGPNIDSFPSTNPAEAPFLDLAGAAEVAETGFGVHLVPQEDSKAGAVWTRRKVMVARGFNISFTFNLRASSGDPDSDGISFVVQNSGAAPTLTTGGHMGYTGIANSVAVEFDHWQNPETQDPNDSHVSIQSGGLGAANGATHNFSFQIAVNDIAFQSGQNFAQIVYDPRPQTLTVFLNNNQVVQAQSFRLENSMNLDDGRAYIGVVATTGVEADTYGPTLLSSFGASFPQSCEQVFWEKPENHTLFTGYNGDVFDHKITGTFLQQGDRIREEVTWLSDDVGLTQDDKDGIEGSADGIWEIGSRSGVPGLWRMRDPAMPPPVSPDDKFDHHGIDTRESQTSTFRNFLDAGGINGTVMLLQTMKLIDADGNPANDTVVARHRLTFRYVKIDSAFTDPPPGPPSCTFGELYLVHQTVKKQSAHNTTGVWESANADPPWIPCP